MAEIKKNRQPGFNRLSIFASRRRQAKQLPLHLGRRRLAIVSVRNFRTQKANRTKKARQTVIVFPFFGIKEIALTGGPKSQPNSWRYQVSVGLPIAAGLAGMVVFSANLVSTPNLELARHSGQVKAATKTAKAAFTYGRSLPVELKIPKIGIDAPVEQVSLNPDKSLAVPQNYHAVGWYSASPTPGQAGPSVIDGHVDNVAGIGVFWRLRELLPGDVIEVDRADSSIIKFEVTSISQFPQNKFPTQQVYGKASDPQIRLITCGGTFDSSIGHYTDNIVVFGKLIQ